MVVCVGCIVLFDDLVVVIGDSYGECVCWCYGVGGVCEEVCFGFFCVVCYGLL